MPKLIARRSLLSAASGLSLAGPFVNRFPRPSPAASRFDPSFGPAHEALRALREGVISSRELTEHTYARIKKHDSKINAFVTLLEEQALEKARQADAERARGNHRGRLLGLPILVKDSFETAGVRTTCGSKSLENHVPKADAIAGAQRNLALGQDMRNA